MVTGPSPLLAIRHSSARAKANGCGRDRIVSDANRLRVLIRDLPCEAGTPIVADEMEPPVAMSDCRHDIERIADQSVHLVTGVIGRILVEHLRHIRAGSALRRSSRLLPSPAPWAFQKNCDTRTRAEDECGVVSATGRCVEDHAGCRLYGSRFDHEGMVEASCDNSAT